jgi:hypothetical protein
MQQGARELARLDVPPVTNSLAELQWLAGVAHAWLETSARRAAGRGGAGLAHSTDGSPLDSPARAGFIPRRASGQHFTLEASHGPGR